MFSNLRTDVKRIFGAEGEGDDITSERGAAAALHLYESGGRDSKLSG